VSYAQGVQVTMPWLLVDCLKPALQVHLPSVTTPLVQVVQVRLPTGMYWSAVHLMQAASLPVMVRAEVKPSLHTASSKGAAAAAAAIAASDNLWHTCPTM
jgi:hypothetical protein